MAKILSSIDKTMRNPLVSLFISIVLNLTAIGQSQQIPAPDIFTQEISVFSGSFNTPIYSINTDSLGFIYLSTDRGMFRYNGINFQKINDGELLDPSFNSITFLSDKRVMAINFYEGVFEVINNTFFKKDILGIKSNKYTFLDLAEKDGKIYLLTDKALFILNRNFDILHRIDPDTKDETVKEFSQLHIHKKSVFITTSGKYLYKINPDGNFLTYELPYYCKWIITSDQENIYIKCRDLNSPVYIFKNNVLQNYFEVFQNSEITTFKMNKIGSEFFFCSSSGLFSYHPKKGIFKQIIKDKKISDIMIDRVGNYWATSLDGKLITWKTEDKKKFTLPINDEFAFTTKLDRNKFISASSQNRFYKIDFKNNLFHYLGRFGVDDIKFLHYTKDDDHVYFKYGKIDLKSQSYTFMYLGNDMITTPLGEKVFLLNNRVYYQPAGKDCMALNQKKKFIECLTLLHESRAKRAVWLDSSIYILSLDGLLKYKRDTLVEVTDKSTGKRIKGVDLIADSENKYWVATNHSTIDVYYLDFHKKTFDLKYIFPENNSIVKLKYYKPYVLVIFRNGALLIDQKSYEIFDVSSILSASDMQVSDVEIEDDFIYFFFSNKIIVSPIKSDKKILSKIFVTGISDLKAKKYNLNSPSVKLKNNSFFVEFDYLCLGESAGIRIAYRIKDIDTNWNFIIADANKIFFPYMESGDHLLELSVIDQTGKIISNLASISVSVPKPFYYSTYFFVVMLILMVMASALIIYFNEQKSRKKELLNSQIRISKLTALRSRMNPHFVYNILNSIQSLIYIGDKRSASSYLTKFSELMRKVLDLSENENISLVEELNVIELYLELEKLRFGEDFKYSIEVDNELKYLNPEIPGFFIQPFVENSIKHGLMHKRDEKRLLIKVEKGTNNDIRIIVDDNGIGRKKAEEINARRNVKKSSFALEAIRNRIQLINSRLKRKIVLQIFDKVDLNNQPSGTTVILSIPIEFDLES
jgi:sensor histidine kinase YesM